MLFHAQILEKFTHHVNILNRISGVTNLKGKTLNISSSV